MMLPTSPSTEMVKEVVKKATNVRPIEPSSHHLTSCRCRVLSFSRCTRSPPAGSSPPASATSVRCTASACRAAGASESRASDWRGEPRTWPSTVRERRSEVGAGSVRIRPSATSFSASSGWGGRRPKGEKERSCASSGGDASSAGGAADLADACADVWRARVVRSILEVSCAVYLRCDSRTETWCQWLTMLVAMSESISATMKSETSSSGATSVAKPTSGVGEPHRPGGSSWAVGTSKLRWKPDMSSWSSSTSKKDHLPKASKKKRKAPRRSACSTRGGAQRAKSVSVILTYGQVPDMPPTRIASGGEPDDQISSTVSATVMLKPLMTGSGSPATETWMKRLPSAPLHCE
mmetsp:Transcript_31881/g.106424  ORF Transcript_31881/g.106424 Transcript_31881/m.106424 type:complete len:350 (+) Transcript_31881:961-2010(+)